MLYASHLIHFISLGLGALPLILALCLSPTSSVVHFSLAFLAVGVFIIISSFHRSQMVTYFFGSSFILLSGVLTLYELSTHNASWIMLIGIAGLMLFLIANVAGFIYTHARIPHNIDFTEAFGL